MEKEENAEEWFSDPPLHLLRKWLVETEAELKSLDQLAPFLEPEDLEERRRTLEHEIWALREWIKEKVRKP